MEVAAVRTPVMFVVAVLGLGVVLVGLTGLVLLIAGIIRRTVALWVIGLVCLVPALLGAVLVVPLVLYLGIAAPRHVSHGRPHEGPMVQRSRAEGGDFVQMEGDRATARAAGVDIKVIEPGGGGGGSGTSVSHGLGGYEERHELRLGEVIVRIVDKDGRITLAVNGRDYGPVQRGDQVLVTEDREVRVNGARREAASVPM
jgi:hypothetical protein